MNQEAVQVTGNDIPGYAEEKEVLYRKHKPSSGSLTVSDNVYDDSFNQDVGVASEYGKPEHQTIKRVFVDTLDAHAHIDIEGIHFTWHKTGDVTFDVRAIKSMPINTPIANGKAI